MSELRTVQRFTDEAVERAKGIDREDYKRIKHMGKIELTAYLGRLYARGYDAGYKDAKAKFAVADDAQTEVPAETIEQETEE